MLLVLWEDYIVHVQSCATKILIFKISVGSISLTTAKLSILPMVRGGVIQEPHCRFHPNVPIWWYINDGMVHASVLWLHLMFTSTYRYLPSSSTWCF